jgi:hypothetical protein
MINRNQVFALIVVCAALMLSACQGAQQLLPTATPTIDLTLIPTPTLTPTALPTPTPTPTPTAEPTPEPIVPAGPIATARIPFRLGQAEFIEQAGFSFRIPIGYEIVTRPRQVIMTSEDQDTVFTLLGGLIEREDELLTDFEQFIELISQELDEFLAGETYQQNFGDIPGLAAEVTGIYGENKIKGRILIAAPAENQLFYALAISPDTTDGEGWEPEGRREFEAILRTVSFYEPVLPEE